MPRSANLIFGPGGGKDKTGNSGGSFGLRYLYHPEGKFGIGRLGFGGEVAYAGRAERDSFVLVTNGDSKVQGGAMSILLIGRWVMLPDKKIKPYLLGGLGFARNNLQLKTAPAAGFVWSDTGTRETRALIDSTKTVASYALGAGADLDVGEGRFFLGLEGRLQGFGSATYPSTAAGQAAGLQGIRGGMSDFRFEARTGVRF